MMTIPHVIIPQDEYEQLRSIVRIASVIDTSQLTEDRTLVEDVCRLARDLDVQDRVPDLTEVTYPLYERADSLEDRAAVVAKSLMSIGINGPRLGAWPIEPSNMMCEGASIINEFLRRET